MKGYISMYPFAGRNVYIVILRLMPALVKNHGALY